jgi:RNA polymerase sigma-70 factor (ECF subfamily)
MREPSLQSHPFVVHDPDGNVVAYAQTKLEAQKEAESNFGTWSRRAPVSNVDQRSAYERACAELLPEDEGFAYFSTEDVPVPGSRPAQDRSSAAPQVRARRSTTSRRPTHRQASPEPLSAKEHARQGKWAQAMPVGPQNELHRRHSESEEDFEVRLLSASRSGNLTAYAQWYALHKSKLRNILNKALFYREWIDDVLQDTLMQTWRVLNEVRLDADPVEYWKRVVRFATNRAKSYNRRERVRQRGVVGDLQDWHDVDEVFQPDYTLTQPDRVAAQREVNRILQEKVYPHLDPALLETFLLSTEEGLTDVEIADRLGISPVTVSTRLWRVRKRIQVLLGSREEADGLLRNPAPLRNPAREAEMGCNCRKNLGAVADIPPPAPMPLPQMSKKPFIILGALGLAAFIFSKTKKS